MGNPGGTQTSGGNGDVARRRFLLRAIGAGSVALAIPTIVTVAPAAAADVRSAPPEPPQPPGPPQVEPAVEPAGEARGNPAQVLGTTQSRGASLPFTGADVDKPIIGGLGAIAAGGALIYWTADTAAPVPAVEELPTDGTHITPTE
jgi:hypothetical protein